MMNEFISKGPNPRELEEAKNFFRGSFPLTLETLGQMAAELLKLELYDVPFDYLSSYLEAIGKVSLDEINSLASSYLLPEDLIMVVAGRAEDFAGALRSCGEVEVIEYTELVNASLASNTSMHASTTCGS